MDIEKAQWEMRTRFVGGLYGQLVSGVLWLLSRAAITTLIVGGFFIFPITEALVRIIGRKGPLRPANSLRYLGMQAAFVLPLSMPLLLPVGLYRLNWFYPAMMVLLGAHYLPFMFLYGMRMFGALAALLVGGGIVIAMHVPGSFSFGAWTTGAVLLLFAAAGAAIVRHEACSSPTHVGQQRV